MTELTKNIQKAIEENLPSMVAIELKSVLVEWEQLKVENSALKKSAAYNEGVINDLRDLKHSVEQVKYAESSNQEKSRDLELKEKLMDLKEKMWIERIGDIKSITQTVFQSNRFNYQVSTNGSQFDGNTGRSSNVNQTGFISGEVL